MNSSSSFLLDIAGVNILIEADKRALFHALKAFFAGYKTRDIKAPQAAPQHHIHVKLYVSRKIRLRYDKSVPLLFTYGIIKGYALDNDTLLLCDQKTSMIINTKERKAVVFVDRATLGKYPELVSIFLALALIELLRYHNLYYLHAGAVTDNRHSILLCGMSMSGKTTLTLGLALNGYTLCSDDAVLLARRRKKLTAIGFKRNIHATRNTVLHYRHLLNDVQLPKPPSRKSLIPYTHFKTVDSVIPDSILFIELGKKQKTEMTPLSKTQAMSLLIPQSLSMVFFNKLYVDRHIQTLKMLLNQAGAYRCVCGRDLLKDPLIVIDLLHKAKGDKNVVL